MNIDIFFKKKSFTALELIFVIIIIGILSLISFPKQNDLSLYKSSNQLLLHIKYTQHLAMIDNKFLPLPYLSIYKEKKTKINHSKQWFNNRWQIAFHINTSQPKGFREYYYSIFSDIPWKNDKYSYDRRLNIPASDYSYTNIAVDPITNKTLTGINWSDRILNYDKRLNLKDEYGIF